MRIRDVEASLEVMSHKLTELPCNIMVQVASLEARINGQMDALYAKLLASPPTKDNMMQSPRFQCPRTMEPSLDRGPQDDDFMLKNLLLDVSGMGKVPDLASKGRKPQTRKAGRVSGLNTHH